MPAASVESVLYRFRGGTDGAGPGGGLIADATGALYGVTVYGGAHNYGTVYKLTSKGAGYSETILYNFKGGTDGASPAGRLIADNAGTLYGTTSLGGNLSCDNVLGSGCGTLFALTRSGSHYVKRTLYMFKGYPSDGTQPGTLIADASGAFYGTTTFGGSSGKCPSEGPGCGTVFRLSPSGKSYQESVLHTFNGGKDGLYASDGLLMDRAGKLYGTTNFGGSTDNGTVFRLIPSKRGFAETVLYSFKNLPDGFFPNGSLIDDRSGTLYGTTLNGGAGCNSGCGTAFSLRRSGSGYTETVLYNFQGSPDAAYPSGGLLVGKGGVLYGVSADGGSFNCYLAGCGAVYELKPSGSSYIESVLYGFKGGRDGIVPEDTILFKGSRLYGTTLAGGILQNSGLGTAFSVTP